MRIATPVLAVLASTTTALAGLYQTVTIDFDDQPGGLPPVVTDGLFSSHATFSTTNDSVLLIFNNSSFVGGTDPNNLSAALSPNASTFNSDIYVDFTQAVQNLSLNILADNSTGVIASLTIYHVDGIASLDILGNGDFTDPIHMDLSGYFAITHIELVNITDEFGLSIDDLVFDIPVPAPAGTALLALAGCMANRRRRA